jgi:hypothetical protein
MSNPRRAPIDQVSFVNRRRSEGVSWAAIVDELATRGMRTSSRGLRRLIASLGGEEPRGTASGRRDVADRPLDASERRADPSASTPRYESHGQHVGADLSERAILTEQIVLLGGDLARKIPPADRARVASERRAAARRLAPMSTAPAEPTTATPIAFPRSSWRDSKNW